MSDRVFIYDTTLRDGAQTEGISFSAEDKADIYAKLDDFGIDFIEGGMPSSNPKDHAFVSLSGASKRKSTFVSFGSTMRPGTDPCNDSCLVDLANGPTKWVCIFGKAWDFHVKEALGTTLDENIRMIEDSIAYLKDAGKSVIFDAEHFFDGYRFNKDYAMDVVRTAMDSGADWVVLCDTNGGSLPKSVGDATAAVCRTFDVPVGVHCHNDSELAVACSLAAVDSGARMVQGTVNGIGERCGNANLCSVIPDLILKMGYDVPVDLTKMTAMSVAVSEIANIRHPTDLPFVGERAFAHKGGMHVSALMKDPRTYEHIPPESVGNQRHILISDMSGKASISEKLDEMGIESDDKGRKLITKRIKEMESIGYQYESADASLQLLFKRTLGQESRPFDVRGFRLSIDGIGETDLASEASIKVVDRGGNVEHTASDGDGPVNALDRALRKALSKFYPVLNDVRLTDYKVRVLDEKAATAATVRVIIRSTDGKDSWNTVGVSENVIEASLIALSDSMEYAILRYENQKQRDLK
jgi:2-isopropylmalate synthase